MFFTSLSCDTNLLRLLYLALNFLHFRVQSTNFLPTFRTVFFSFRLCNSDSSSCFSHCNCLCFNDCTFPFTFMDAFFRRIPIQSPKNYKVFFIGIVLPVLLLSKFIGFFTPCSYLYQFFGFIILLKKIFSSSAVVLNGIFIRSVKDILMLRIIL